MIDRFLEGGNVFFFKIGDLQLWFFIRVAGQGGADGEKAVLDLEEVIAKGAEIRLA